MFDYDWFHGEQFVEQKDEAKWRCALRRYPQLDRGSALDDSEFRALFDELRLRVLIYLRDGFSYEMKDLADVARKSHLTFECEPVEEQYRVGAFVISVPYDDIVRVEVYAVPEAEMPVDAPAITGFRGRQEPPAT